MGFTGRTSSSRSRPARRLVVVVVVVLVTVLAAVTGTAGPLYAAVYPPAGGPAPVYGDDHTPAGGDIPAPGNGDNPAPGNGDNPAPADGDTPPGGPPGTDRPPPFPGRDTSVVVSPKGWERALTRASLTTGFQPERVVENERTRFTATITYGRTPSVGPTVQVGYANDAELTSLEPGQFDVTPLTDTRQNLDEGSPDSTGGWSLSWRWDVTPRAAGPLTLQLQIKPIVVMGGSVVDTLARRNKPIEIDVLVHPHRTEFDAVVSAGTEFAANAPPNATAGDDALVTADLPLPGNDPDVHVALSITAADDSVPVEISPRSPPPPAGPDAVRGAWVVRPGKEGVAKLAVAADIVTDVGDRTLTQRIERKVDLVVDPAHAFWPRVLGVVGGATAVLTLLGGLATFRTQYRTPLADLWSRVRRRRSAAASPPPPEPPPAPETTPTPAPRS